MEKWTRLLIMTATALLLLLFVGTTVHLLTYLHHTLLLFALGGLIAYALDPLVEGLRKTRVAGSKRIPSRQVSVAIVFLSLFLLIGFGIWSLSGHLAAQVSALPSYKASALEFARREDADLARRNIHFSLVQTLEHPSAEMQAAVKRAGSDALPLLRHVATDLGESVIVLLIALYFLIFGGEMREKFNELLPKHLRPRMNLWQTDVNRILGGFVRGQFVIALITGAAAALGCLAIGIHPWLLVGLFVVAASLIPVFGPYIGAVPAIIAALISETHFGHNTTLAVIAVVVWFILINEIGSKILYPKLVGAALGLHEVLVLFVLFAGLEINGIVGVLFAAPLTALTIVTLVHLYRYWQDLPDSLLADAAPRAARQAKAEMNAPKGAPEKTPSGA